MPTFTLIFVNYGSNTLGQSVIPNGTTAKIYNAANNTLLDTQTVNNDLITTSVLSVGISNNYYIVFSGSGAPTDNFNFTTGYSLGNIIVISINPPATSSNSSGSGTPHLTARYIGSHLTIFGGPNTNSGLFAQGIPITTRFADNGIVGAIVSSPEASLQITPPPLPTGCTDANLECRVEAYCASLTLASSVEWIQFQALFYNSGLNPVITSNATSYFNPTTGLGLPFTVSSILILPADTTAINFDFQFVCNDTISLGELSLFVYVTLNSIP